MGKKNLDKLFQEKLKDFSGIPEENVWQSIEASLNEKKKKRRIIPLWWKLGGVAALLAIALYVINPFEDTQGVAPIVTNIEKIDEVDQEKGQQKNALENSTIDNNAAIVETDSGIEDDFQTQDNAATSKQDLEKNTQNTSEENKKETLFKLPKKGVTNANQLTTVQSSKKVLNIENADSEDNIEAASILTENQGDAVVGTNNTEQNIIEKNAEQILKKSKENTIVSTSITPEKEGVAQVDAEAVETLEYDVKKKSIFDEIAEQEEEELVAENNKGNKWSAGPSIAPVYYNGIGSGSPVDPIFASNSKSGDVNFSYGLSVAYKVNKKLSIRSGIHKVDYGYETNDVVFSSSLQASRTGKIGNIDYSGNSKNLVVTSNANNINSNISSINDALSLENAASDVSAESAIQNGVLAQQIGYLEVPLELNYALVDKRFGVNLIGGISSLFLIDNSITVSAGDLTTEVGEANNVNTVNFSTNVGLGVNYKVTPKIQFNIEPIFKYQLNTFSGTDGSFRPFSVGVYSGLNLKF